MTQTASFDVLKINADSRQQLDLLILLEWNFKMDEKKLSSELEKLNTSVIQPLSGVSGNFGGQDMQISMEGI